MAPKRKREESGAEVVNYGEVFVNDVVDLAKTSTAHTPEQAEKVKKLAMVMINYMSQEIANSVVLAENAPMLQYYSCDGTPLRTQVRAKRVIGKKTIRREGNRRRSTWRRWGFCATKMVSARSSPSACSRHQSQWPTGNCPGHLLGG